MMENLEPKTLSVPDAGRIYFGLGAWGSYAAAKRGDIPTIKIGRRIRVPVVALERMLEAASVDGTPAPQSMSKTADGNRCVWCHGPAQPDRKYCSATCRQKYHNKARQIGIVELERQGLERSDRPVDSEQS